ncbi:hypothetical protein [Desulforamulus putei]|uniref:hypothetical protein n=1 Tax=Desulforamulus putei TaxID=74701 RepID=UPI002FDE87AF
MFTIEENGIGLARLLVLIGGGITLAALIGGVYKLLKHFFLTVGLEQRKAGILAVFVLTGFAAVALYKTSSLWMYLLERSVMQ